MSHSTYWLVVNKLYTCIYSFVKCNKPLLSKIIYFDKIPYKNTDTSTKVEGKISLFTYCFYLEFDYGYCLAR